MSKYNKTVLTEQGLELAAKAAKGRAKFTISKAAASDEKLTGIGIDELEKLTQLPGIVQYGQIKDVANSTQDKDVVIGVSLLFDNQSLDQSHDLNTIGLYAKEEGSDEEILYALTTAVEPETLPDYQDEVLFKFNITMFVVVGRADNVTVKVVEDGVVTEDKLKEIIKTLPSKKDLTDLSDSLDSKISTVQTDLNEFKTSTNQALKDKANAADVYTKAEVDKKLTDVDDAIKTVDGIKPDKDGNVQTDHYTKAEVDKKVTDLNSAVEAEEHREWTHHADTYELGVAYSKAHPDVLVSTP